MSSNHHPYHEDVAVGAGASSSSHIEASKITFSLQDIPDDEDEDYIESRSRRLYHHHNLPHDSSFRQDNSNLFDEEAAYLYSTTMVPYLLFVMLLISAIMLASLSSTQNAFGSTLDQYYMYAACAKKELPLHHSTSVGGVPRSFSADMVRRRNSPTTGMDTIVEEIRYLSD